MRRLLIIMAVTSALSCSAGRMVMNDGKTVAYWDDRTAPVRYNGYRVEIKLTDTYTKNVWGSVSLFRNNKLAGTRNFMINAGEKTAYADFDNLTDDASYEIKVTIDGK